MSLPEVNSPNFTLFPSELVFENYSIIGEYLPYLINTLIVVVINGLFIPLTGAMIAFPFARYTFKGKRVMFLLLMARVGYIDTFIRVIQQTRFARYARFAVGRRVFRRQRDADISDYSVHARNTQGT